MSVVPAESIGGGSQRAQHDDTSAGELLDVPDRPQERRIGGVTVASILRVCLLLLAVSFMSSGGVAFALVKGVPPMLKAAWRMWSTCILQVPLFIIQWCKLPEEGRARWLRSYLTLLFSGLFLGLHFASWTWSIDHTSLAHSLLWVTSHPVVVVSGMWAIILIAGIAACKPLLRGYTRAYKPSHLETLGAILGFAGGALSVLEVTDDSSPVTFHGDAVAFLGAVAIAVHLVVGHMLREWMDLFLYTLPVTLVAAFVCSGLAFSLEGASLAGTGSHGLFGWLFTPEWLLLVGYMGFGPGCMGHAMADYCLKYLSPLLVSVTMLLEPLVGSLIGVAFGKQDMPGLWTWLGGPVLLIGAVLVSVGSHRRHKAEEEGKSKSAVAPHDTSQLEADAKAGAGAEESKAMPSTGYSEA